MPTRLSQHDTDSAKPPARSGLAADESKVQSRTGSNVDPCHCVIRLAPGIGLSELFEDKFLEHRERTFFFCAARFLNRWFQKIHHIPHMLRRKQVESSRQDGGFKDRMSGSIEAKERTPFAPMHNR